MAFCWRMRSIPSLKSNARPAAPAFAARKGLIDTIVSFPLNFIIGTGISPIKYEKAICL